MKAASSSAAVAGMPGGAASILPVDIFIPGCPPCPEAIIDGLLAAVGRMGSAR